jgi:hypothetical protein
MKNKINLWTIFLWSSFWAILIALMLLKFNANAQPFVVSGTVTMYQNGGGVGAPLADVNITDYNQTVTYATTNANGDFSFVDPYPTVPGWHCLIKPHLEGYVFVPEYRQFAITYDMTYQNFEAIKSIIDLIGIPSTVQTNTFVPIGCSDLTLIPSDPTFGCQMTSYHMGLQWSMIDPGTTNVQWDGSNYNGYLYFNNSGVCVVRATIEKGVSLTQPFIKDFTIEVTAPPIIAVTDITNVPTTATVGVNLTLNGTVIPTNATNKTINWEVKNGGGRNCIVKESKNSEKILF